MGKPEAPTPPNPYQTAAAATGTNVSTAVANAYLNNTNQVTPDGSLSYSPTNNYSWTDPSTGQTYNIPQFTATQTLTPQGQAIRSQLDAARYNLAGMANSQSGRIAGILSQGMDYSGAPGPGEINRLHPWGTERYDFSSGGPVQTSLGDYGRQQTTFGDAGDITRTYGPSDNFSADRQRYEDALMQRMNPQLERERGNIEQRLQDQGIRYGSQAYTSAMDDYNRQANDARFAAVGAGGQEQARMNQMAAQLAAFQNASQGQAYQQELGRGDFANKAQENNYQQALGAGAFRNQAQAQQFTQNSMQAQFYNQALQQDVANRQAIFNAQQSLRSQWMNEQYAQRNQPINEITALMNGSQVSNPNFVNTPNNQIPTTDVAGLINTGYNQQAASYQQQMSNWNDLVGGVLGLGAGIFMSDEREKENIKRVGTVLATKGDEPKMATVFGDERELPIYEYSYKRDPSSTRHVGPMAQDVEKVDKRAVRNIGGRKFIDGAQLGSILRAA